MAVIAKGVFTTLPTLSGFGQASDGQQVLAANERWLVAANTPSDGLWVTQAGAWLRAPELNESKDFVWGNDNTVVRIRGGNEWGNSEWGYNGVDNPTIGLATLYFAVRLKYYASETATELTSYIEGLGLSYVDANTIGLSPGRAYVPGLGKVLTVQTPQTITVPAGMGALFYCYLEEFPTGSGLGRLRVITTAPGEPYLASARTQSDDPTARSLGMIRRSTINSGVLIPFDMFVMGGSAYLYNYFDAASTMTVILTNFGNPTVTEKSIGPTATSAVDRLLDPSAKRVELEYNYDSAGVSPAFRVGWDPANPTGGLPPTSVYGRQNSFVQGYVTSNVGPNQLLRYNSTYVADQLDLAVSGYWGER